MYSYEKSLSLEYNTDHYFQLVFMEKNNNLIVKALALTLIVILTVNVYRTETTKKDLVLLAEKVEKVQADVDSLEGLPSGRGRSAVSDTKVKGLERRVANLETVVNALKADLKNPSKAKPKQQALNDATVSQTIDKSTTQAPASAESTTSSIKKPVTVSAKVKLENRYVRGTTYLPRVSVGPEGVVIITITVDQMGRVNKVSLNTGSTISDEDIVDLCKECALKTDFSTNWDAPEKSVGKITYRFTAK